MTIPNRTAIAMVAISIEFIQPQGPEGVFQALTRQSENVQVGPSIPTCTKYASLLYNNNMVRISVSKARERLSEVVEMSQSEPVMLELYGKRAAVMVSPDKYDEMLEALEESHDVAAFDAALAEVGDNIPWEQVKSDLGWS